ncbi:LOW QUALITY PROTEIN: leucine zipper putative tumor suppressor 2a [Eucyclogobius newberryi]|uniref:LOW QUALITY PROTEIN: leucine zipper putative tumor suppressor 2a n=1 Tax=Eucyclogobius newberryi TaxID=166745 RepID=UPI003B59A990
MALVQALPVSVTEHPAAALEVGPCSGPRPCPNPGSAMGSVSSLISGRTYQERHCRAASEFSSKPRRSTPATSCFRLPDNSTLRSGSSLEQLLVISNHNQPQGQVPLPPPLPTKKHPRLGTLGGSGAPAAAPTGATAGVSNGNYTYSEEVVVGDWNDTVVLAVTSPCSDSEEQRDHRALNGNIGGPPPKLIPVSGQLEKNMEKVLIRPTAFKPVVPKNRHSVQYLAPRQGGNLSESQGSLNLLLPLGGSNISTNANTANTANPTSTSEDKCHVARNARNSQSCSMSDSGRNSLSSLPTHSSTGYSLAPSEGSGSGSGGPTEQVGQNKNTSGGSVSHGHTNSDSGRSSSSKSSGSGSVSGRGQPLSDSGSCGHSPPPVEGYEIVVRELEEKLRERDLELQQLRENLDENEAAICQVYEEKQRRCEREMEELRQSCASKMKQTSQKAQRAQQVLQLQVFQLQQEKKKLQEDFSALLQDRETLERRCATIQREQTQLGPRLEETKWEVCQKSGEISLLKQQLNQIQSELSQKAGDIVTLKAQLREARSELQSSQARTHETQTALRTRALELEVCENELQRRKSEAELLREKVGRLEEESKRKRDIVTNHNALNGNAKGQCVSQRGRAGPSPSVYRDGEETHLLWGGESDEAKAQRQNVEAVLTLRQQVERLKAELMYERRTSEEHLSRFEGERRVWQEEKEKVIRYQKQLQQNYIQMYRRNRDLERVMRELSLELENRDMEEYEVRSGSNDIHFEEITATEI